VRICFTGGRNYDGLALVGFVIDLLSSVGRDVEISVGDCPTGLDRTIRELAKKHCVWSADWDRYGKAAGPIRNRQMLEGGGTIADLLIAFPGGAGTEDCVEQAIKLGIQVLRVPF